MMSRTREAFSPTRSSIEKPFTLFTRSLLGRNPLSVPRVPCHMALLQGHPRSRFESGTLPGNESAAVPGACLSLLESLLLCSCLGHNAIGFQFPRQVAVNSLVERAVAL